MASASFDFDDLDPSLPSVPLASVASASLPAGEFLDFDAFVEVSSPAGLTGGG